MTNELGISFNRPKVKAGSTELQKRVAYSIEDLMPDSLPVFWETQWLSKDKKVLTVNPQSFIRFLESAGFRKVIDEENTGKTEYVRVNHNILYPVSVPNIKDYLNMFFDWVSTDIHRGDIEIDDNGHSLVDLINYVYKHTDTLFKVGLLDMMKTFEGKMFKATKLKNAFFFKDCWVEITPEGISIKDYRELPSDMAIWKRDVVDFSIKPYDPKNTNCDFKKFIQLITGLGLAHTDEEKRVAGKRNEMMETAMGYLLHPFYEGALRAILITDVNSTLDIANGRTGKGLIAKALSEIVPTAIVPAKRWSSKDKFNFEQANKDTKLVVLDDLASGFHSEELYNVVTEGIVVKKVYQQPFTIHTKVLVNTNTMMKGEGSSTRGRFLEIEIDNFFSDRYKPIDHFKRNFFSKHDWDEKEWGAFYWYLMNCSFKNLVNVSKGLDCGVDYLESDNIELKRILTNVEQEFFDLMESKSSQWSDTSKFPTVESRTFEVKDIREEYLEDQNDKFRKLSNQKVRGWIQSYCKYKGYTLELVRKPSNRSHYAIRFDKQLFD